MSSDGAQKQSMQPTMNGNKKRPVDETNTPFTRVGHAELLRRVHNAVNALKQADQFGDEEQCIESALRNLMSWNRYDDYVAMLEKKADPSDSNDSDSDF